MSETEETTLDYSGFTKDELLTLVADRGLEGVSSSNTKAEIIAALEADDAANAAETGDEAEAPLSESLEVREWPQTHAGLDKIAASDPAVDWSSDDLTIEEKIGELEAAGVEPPLKTPGSPSTQEKLPVITTSTWVRLGIDSPVPENYRGRDAIITLAPTERHEADDWSPTPYESQDADTVFMVKTRDDGQYLELKRESFAVVNEFGQPLGAPPEPWVPEETPPVEPPLTPPIEEPVAELPPVEEPAEEPPVEEEEVPA